MFTVKLFLGVPVDHSLASFLEKMNPHLREVFINEGEYYLNDVIYRGERYLGKFADQMPDIQSLELLEKNIYSLLLKVAPGYSYRATDLVLFPLKNSDLP